MPRQKVTEDSFDLNRKQAEALANKYVAKAGKIKHNSFKQGILNKLEEILDRGYRNEAGIKALASLLPRHVEIEVRVKSDGVKGKSYYCVHFKDGGFGCTCTKFTTWCNVVRPREKCKHILACVNNGTF